MPASRDVHSWFQSKNWIPNDFQVATWNAYRTGVSGMIQAPTGMGKTYAGLGGALDEAKANGDLGGGVRVIWIAPIRALAKEIQTSAEAMIAGLGLGWKVGVRTGDTSAAERARQRKSLPEVLITTPESLHLLFCLSDHAKLFRSCRLLVVDEWHALLGTKRGIQIELAAAHLRAIAKGFRVWGLTATIGNLEEALDVLCPDGNGMLVGCQAKKDIEVISLMPSELERLAWSGFLGVQLLSQVLEVIQSHGTTLVFTNTRSQAEIWYHQLLEADASLAGILALHHGSMAKEARVWIEDAIGAGVLKAVVCTSSLDLGVDFPPVDAVVQIGSPKGVARFLQRAGRSGHRPGGRSRIYFVPTHGLELMEGSALRDAMDSGWVERREPVIRAFDVLAQWLCTRALGGGFLPEEAKSEVFSTHAFKSLSADEWQECLAFVRDGGTTLRAYEEYRRVEINDGRWVMSNRTLARRHRMSIGTIVSDPMIAVRLQREGLVGHVESSFIERMQEGDVFWFAGRQLELLRLQGATAEVKRSKRSTKRVPVWTGGRLPLSSELGHALRLQLDAIAIGDLHSPELSRLIPLMSLQDAWSHIPQANELLIEEFETEDGHHLCLYPFEGRAVHEGLAMLLSHRLGNSGASTITYACNDYGFELLSEDSMGLDANRLQALLSSTELESDVLSSLNASELGRRRFKEIAIISGLQFQPKEGNSRSKHLQTHSGLLYEVFADYDADHVLFQQVAEEVLSDQLQIAALHHALDRLTQAEWKWQRPEQITPLSFPLVIDRLRGTLSSEHLEDRIQRMAIAR